VEGREVLLPRMNECRKEEVDESHGACDCKSKRRGSENDQLHQHRGSDGTGRKKGAAWWTLTRRPA
jgi:hypothetical protein